MGRPLIPKHMSTEMGRPLILSTNHLNYGASFYVHAASEMLLSDSQRILEFFFCCAKIISDLRNSDVTYCMNFATSYLYCMIMKTIL